jgi:hypothetical protein
MEESGLQEESGGQQHMSLWQQVSKESGEQQHM